MVHYAGYTPRFHPSDFATHSRDGVGADWPIDYEDLQPYYAAIEGELPVAGEDWPWGDPHRYPHEPAPRVGGNGELFQRGADALGIPTRVGPVAITNGRFGHRQHCIYRGFCLQGCKVNAKASPLITHIPDALAHGAEIRPDSMVTAVEIDERTGRATGVRYMGRGVERFQRAAHVIVAGYSIETPRLLLHSTSRRFPDGLCNDFDLVGRYLMVQGAPQTGGRFADEVRMYKAPPPEVSTEHYYETDPAKPYKRGFSIQTVSPLADHLGRALRRPRHWGADAARLHARLRALGVSRRAVRVPAPGREPGDARRPDRPARHAGGAVHLQPVRQRPGTDGHGAQGSWSTSCTRPGPSRSSRSTATPTWWAGPAWAPNERSGVVDSDCRSFAVPNLLITDGSVLPTQGAANPALTIMAVAARAADGSRPTAADRRQRAQPTYWEETMAMTVADYVLERLREWDVEKVFGYAGDGINGLLAAWGRADNDPHVRPGPARGDGGVRSRRLRQVLRQGRRLRGDVRTGCHPSAQRALRREARPCAGGRHRRPDRPGPRWAGRTSRRSTCSACSRTSRATTSRWSPCPSSCPTCWTGPSGPRSAERAPTAHDHPRRRPGAGLHASRPRLQDGPLVAWASAGRRVGPTTTAIATAADILNAGEKVAILVGRAPAAPAPRSSRSPSCSAPASPKPLLGKDVLSDDLPYVTGSIGLLGTRPSYEMMRDCDTLLTSAPTSPTPSSSRARPGPRHPDRHRRQDSSACATPPSSTSSRTPPATLRALLPAA